MKDYIGIEFKIGDTVLFERESTDGKLKQKVPGEVIDILDDDEIIVQDEATDTYTVSSNTVEVIKIKK